MGWTREGAGTGGCWRGRDGAQLSIPKFSLLSGQGRGCALVCKALQLLVGWHPPGLRRGTSKPGKPAVNPAPGLWLWDQHCRNIATQNTDLPPSPPAGPNSCLVTSVLALRLDQHLAAGGIKLVET